MENQEFDDIFDGARRASSDLAAMSDEERSAVILTLADLVEAETPALLAANAGDLALMDPANPLYDRVQLTEARLAGIAADLRHVASLPSPLGEELEHRTLENGIDLRRVRTPFGVVGIVYEARPNVTFDVFALTLRTANASVLKGGHDAQRSNEAAIALIHRALAAHGVTESACTLLPSTHEATAAMLTATGKIDICIPRGGRRLIDFVRQNARIPVIETGAGVVHVYLHADADPGIARRVVDNAKTRRVSVCNALDAVLVDRAFLPQLAEVFAPLAEKGVTLHADAEARKALAGHYPAQYLVGAVEGDEDREWMSMQMGVYTVDGPDEAVEHIARHGSGHSESVVTADADVAADFQRRVDAACVYVNLPTSFTDGGQFGLGAEIGISTQKLGPRGPMGLAALTTYKWLLTGNGQTRP